MNLARSPNVFSLSTAGAQDQCNVPQRAYVHGGYQTFVEDSKGSGMQCRAMAAYTAYPEQRLPF